VAPGRIVSLVSSLTEALFARALPLLSRGSARVYALDIPAAREDGIHLVDGKLPTWYGPRMAGSLIQIYALLRY
jgi:hypothetical protein